MTLENIGSLGYGGAYEASRLPRAILELQALTISGPLTGASANTAIAVTDGLDIQDTIVKALQVVTSTGVWSNLTVLPTAVFASGTLTLSGVVAGDTATVNGKLYTASTLATNPTTDVPPYAFLVGASDTITAANLAAAINSGESATGTYVPLVAATSAAAVVTVKALTAGTGGNSITLAVGASHISKSGTTLASGALTAAAVSIVDLRAKATLTLASVVAGDTAVVNGKTYTFITATVTPSYNLAPYAVVVGASDTASATNLAAAINSMDGSLLVCTSAAGVVTVQAVAEGTAGNAITTVGSPHITASGSTLSGGSATNAIKVTSDTTGAQVFIHWYKKSRLIGQL